MEKSAPHESTEYSPLRKECDNSHDETKNIKSKLNHRGRTDHVLVPPDGGWGWMVVLGSFIIMVVSTFPVFGFGILFSPLLMSFDVSSSKIAWIFNIYALVWCIFTLFMGPLQEELGWRKVTIFGGILNSLSIIISAFAPSPDFLFLSFSILGGIAGATGITTSFIVISRYFVKRRGFTIGITSLGACISSFISPLFANYLLENYGYVDASLIYGSVILHQCVGGALFQPVEWHMKSVPVEKCTNVDDNLNEPLNKHCSSDNVSYQILPTRRSQSTRRLSTLSLHSAVSLEQLSMDVTYLYKNTISEDDQQIQNLQNKSNKNRCHLLTKIMKSTYNNLKTLKFMRVITISIATGTLLLGYANFQMWIPFVVMNTGHSLEHAAWCVSAASIANIVGRVITLLLADRKRFNIQYANLFGIFLIGISIFAFSMVEDFTHYLICMCFWGFGIGISMCLNTTIMIAIMGVDLFPAVFGVSALSNGLFGIVLGPIVGAIRDATSSYMYAIWLLGGAVVVSLCMWLMMPFAVKFDERKLNKDAFEPQSS